MDSKSDTINELLNIKEASKLASEYLGKNVTTANIIYLINYGRISKLGDDNSILISKEELIQYYNSFKGSREFNWKTKLGTDLNWALSFENLKEAETTKHVHRLHPYKGKFIPQLVEYFLDSHTDNFKQNIYFHKGDIILDPFCGSGTTLVQANELGINAIGVDISAFNTLISNIKISPYDEDILIQEILRITNLLEAFSKRNNTSDFEKELTAELNEFNNKWFPVPDFKRQVQLKEINGEKYGQEKEEIFLPIYKRLVQKYDIKLLQPTANCFIEKWYTEHIREEIDFVFNEIKKIKNTSVKNILCIVLSRTMRSCRATTHADLATLKDPIINTYYCAKHGKICKPIFSILKWWKTYSKDTVNRLHEFSLIRTNSYQLCITGDSRSINIPDVIKTYNMPFYELICKNKIKGIFSSPPYVGLINYHEQHAYAYDLFGFTRNDEQEIGPLYKGQGNTAKENYVIGISAVLNNAKQFLADDFDIFLVANDKYGLYPSIAENSGLQIVNQYKRPVLNRTEKDKGAYSEIIFHLKDKTS